jgi:hypothetical protein
MTASNRIRLKACALIALAWAALATPPKVDAAMVPCWACVTSCGDASLACFTACPERPLVASCVEMAEPCEGIGFRVECADEM